MAMARQFLVIVCALWALRGISATTSHSGATKRIVDDAASQEAEIDDKDAAESNNEEAPRERKVGYIETGVDDEDVQTELDDSTEESDDQENDQKETDEDEALAPSWEVREEREEKEKAAQAVNFKATARRNLRAKPQVTSPELAAPPPPQLAALPPPQLAALPPPQLAANILDPSQWKSNSSGEAASMEKQLTDLMMSGHDMSATPFGKSVKQISKLIKDDMMAKVLAAHKSNQEQLVKESKAIGDCGSTKDSQVVSANMKKALYLKTSPLHKTCRAGEEGKLNEKTEAHSEMKDKKRIKELKCKEFAMVGRQYGDQQANGQIVKKGGSEHTESYISRITSTICGHPFVPHQPQHSWLGMGGAGKNGFKDNYLRAKLACQGATNDYNKATAKYNSAAEMFAAKQAECDSLQDQMDHASCKRAVEMKDACEAYAECYLDRKKAHDTTTKMVKSEEKDRKAEWRGLKRMQCLMKAFDDGQVSSGEVRRCKNKQHETNHLVIHYPKIPKLVTCSVPKLYPSTPEYKLAEFGPLPALAKGKQDANECTGIVEIATKPAQGSPTTCQCERVTLNGPYSAGPLVKCSNCLEARRSLDRNSCPDGTKIFAPRSASDWRTVLSSVGELKAPLIVDVTRPRSGCGRCHSKPMNSLSSGQGKEWQTSDGAPWWLRSTKYSEPNGDYQPNCYLRLKKLDNENTIQFNDAGCKFYAKSYYCQLKTVSMEPKKASPSACTCKSVTLAGPYSAGALIKCSNCLDISRSMQKNSCPMGTKLFSPANAQDWKTFLASAGPLRSPSWIIDITRSQDGCGGCQHKPMNSRTPSQMTWRTADGSPWWLRSSTYSEPNGDYTANCYMDLWKTPFSNTNIMFNDQKCKAHSDSYYCQPVMKKPVHERMPPSLAAGDDEMPAPPAALWDDASVEEHSPAKATQLPCNCVPCGSKKPVKYPGGSCGPKSSTCGPSKGGAKDGCYSSAQGKTCDCKTSLTAKAEKKSEDEGDDEDDDDNDDEEA